MKWRNVRKWGLRRKGIWRWKCMRSIGGLSGMGILGWWKNWGRKLWS